MPRDLAAELPGHEVRTVGQQDWKGLDNGELLAEAAGRFDALISMDKTMPVERNVSRYQISLVLVGAVSNRIEALRPLIPAIQAALASVRPGEVKRVNA